MRQKHAFKYQAYPLFNFFSSRGQFLVSKLPDRLEHTGSAQQPAILALVQDIVVDNTPPGLVGLRTYPKILYYTHYL